jgi:hypothetical protein
MLTDDEQMAEAVVESLGMRCREVVGEQHLCDGELYDLPARPRPFSAGNYKRGRVCRKCGASQWEDPNWYEPN